MNEQDWRELDSALRTGQLEIDGHPVVRGDRVRLHPHERGDIMDSTLAGRTAVIESVEQDFEGKFHCVVVLDDDPGSDLGFQRMPGHRFFFGPEEIEVIEHSVAAEPAGPTVLVAGIGNIFMGDDAFGVEVIRRLGGHEFPRTVRVADFGIRGYDLAYALLEEYDHTLLIDACPRGGAPGTIYVIEPDIERIDDPDDSGILDGHGMNPMNVLRLARSMGGRLMGIRIIGCEPETLGPGEGLMGLSAPVEAAVGEAVKLIDSLVAELLAPRARTDLRTPH